MPLKLTKRGGVWHITGTEAGYRIRKSTHIDAVGRDNKARAEAMLNEVRDTLRRQAAQGNDAVIKVGFLVDHYLQGKSPRHSDITRRIFSFFGDDTTISDAIDMIDDYRIQMHQKELKPATIVNYLANITAVFAYAQKRKWTDRVVKLDKPKVKLAIKALKENEVNALIDHAPDWLKPHLIFLRNTGLRTGELLTLKRDDVDLENRRAVIRDTKNGEDRVIPLNDAAVKVIRDLPFDDILFRNHEGQPFGYSKDDGNHYLNRPVAAAAKRAGIRHVTPHMLRHTFATRLVEAGANIEVVRALGGWKSITMAARYGKADLRTQDQYANLISKDYTDAED